MFADNGNGTGAFTWTPQEGQAGTYSITFRASDGALTAARTAQVYVHALAGGTGTPTPGSPVPTTPGTPSVTPSGTPATVTTTATPTPTPTPTAGCPATPVAGCRTPGKSQLRLKNNPDDRKDSLGWSWLKGPFTTFADLGDPVNGSTAYHLCIYDEIGNTAHLVLDATAPAGGTCAKGRPCWKQIGSRKPTGFKYSDGDLTPDGLLGISLKSGGDGKAKLVVSGKGVNLRMADPAGLDLLSQDTKVIVQLSHSGGGTCWESAYPAPALRNTTSKFMDTLP
jgi:hypothetical protein